MKPRPRIWIVLAATFVVAACGGPRVAADRPASAPLPDAGHAEADTRLSAELRLSALTLPLLRGARVFCRTNTQPHFGLSAKDQRVSGRGARRGRVVQITSVVPASPAYDAGLRAGDVVLSANGVRPGRAGSRVIFDAMRDGGYRPLWLLTRREDTKHMVRIDPVEICDIPVELAGTFNVRAWSAGGKVKVGKGLIRLGLNDAELALIVSHELSHVILGHTGSFSGREAARIEDDADTMALYLMARAGFQPAQSLSLFPRLGAAFPGLDGEYSHVALRRRCSALVRIIAEIAVKQAAGQDLIPGPTIWRNRDPVAAGGVGEPFAERLRRIGLRLQRPVPVPAVARLNTSDLQEACS